LKNITFDVSVVIPFKDEVNMLQGFIDALLLQETNLSYELLIIDSSLESKENELNFYSLDYRYIKIKPSEFNHGQTRNCAVGLSKSNYILFTVQDAIPDKKNWLQLSVDVIKNNNLDACCGGQYVDMAPGKNPVEWSTSNYSLNCDILQFQPNKFADLSKEEQRQKSQWDNVNAIYKKESLLNLPFKEILFAEDAQWALDALQKGFKIGYKGYPPVLHYHHYNEESAKKRYFAEFYILKKIYDIDPMCPKLNLKQLISWGRIILKSPLESNQRIKWFVYNLKLHSAKKEAFKSWKNHNKLNEAESILKYNSPISNANNS